MKLKCCGAVRIVVVRGVVTRAFVWRLVLVAGEVLLRAEQINAE
jgi:hypothetical protein